MAGSDPSPIVSMEVLVKWDNIPPVWIILKFTDSSMYGTSPGFIAEKDMRQSTGELRSHLIQRNEVAGTYRILYLVRVAEIVMKLLDGLDQQIVDWEPYRPPPV